VVCVITDFRTDRDKMFIFGGGVAGLMQNMSKIASDRETACGVCNHRVSNGSRNKVQFGRKGSGPHAKHGEHRIGPRNRKWCEYSPTFERIETRIPFSVEG
jgi:hypothetical protein